MSGDGLIDKPPQMQSHPTTPPRKRGFFDLPFGSAARHLWLSAVDTTHQTLHRDPSYYELDVALLSVNRQVNDEAQAVLDQNQFVHIKAWLDFNDDILAPVRFPLTAKDAAAKPFRRPHLAVSLEYFGNANKKMIRGCHTWVSCAEDIPQLCRLLHFFDCETPSFCQCLRLSLTVLDQCEGRVKISSQAMQEALLMPFAILKNLASFHLRGSKLESVEDKLRKTMKVPNPTPTDLLEGAMNIKLDGNAAFKNGDYALSIRKYHAAYAEMHTIVSGPTYAKLLDRWFANTPLTGKLAGQRGDLLRHQLGLQLNWNILQAYLSLKDWGMAYYWGDRAISDIELANVHQRIFDGANNLVTEAEKAKVYLRITIACHKVGKAAEAKRNLQKASMYAPPDSVLSLEIKKTQREIMQKIPPAQKVNIPYQGGWLDLRTLRG